MRIIGSLLLLLNFSHIIQAQDDMAWAPVAEPVQWARSLPYLDDDDFFRKMVLLADLNNEIEFLI